MHFYSIDCQKAGFLIKNKGVWYLTDEGEKSLSLGALKMLDAATAAYRVWVADNKTPKNHAEIIDVATALEEDLPQVMQASLDLLEEQAISGIKDYLCRKNPYEFQNWVAALLRGMNYHTPFVSPKGKDGGIDIVAYSDPLGATAPRLKVQVKHRPDAAIPVDDIRSLNGLLNKVGDVGLFVTSGRFTSESERFARESHIHLRLLDVDELIELWVEFYPKLNDEDKNLLPLQPIYFLGNND